MRRRRHDFPLASRSQFNIHFFERSKKSRERILQRFRPLPRLPEIAMPELVRRGNYRRAHRSIFVSSLRPREPVFAVNPQTESHKTIMTLVLKVLQ